MTMFKAPVSVIISGRESALFGKPALVVASSHKVSKFQGVIKTEKEIVDRLSKSENDDLNYLASYAVCLVASYLKTEDLEKINTAAYRICKKLNKKFLGFETSVATYGGLFYFRREFEFLKNISKLNFKLPKKIEENLYIVDSKKPSQALPYNKKMEKIYNEMEKNTKRMTVAVAGSNIDFFKEALDKNNELALQIGLIPTVFFAKNPREAGIISRKYQLEVSKLSQDNNGLIKEK